MGEANERSNWAEANPRKAKLIVFVVCVLFVEGAVRLVVWAGLLPYERYPTSREPQYWAYVDPVVGMWRRPHASFVDEGRCYTVHYDSNSVGARDRERSLRSDAPRRVMVLGDSYVEGYGHDAESRVTELLEARTGIEHLNWGTAGGFGTIQEWLLYESKVKAYDHTDVMLFILPDNDFKDNDPDEYSADTYRPYLRRSGEGYEVYYTVAFEDRDTSSRTIPTVIKNTLDNEVYILNALRLAARAVSDSGALPSAEPQPTYTRYSEEDLAIFLHALGRLIEAVGDKQLYLFLIPREFDIDYVRRHGYEFALVDELVALASRHGNVHFADLLPGFLDHAVTNAIDVGNFSLGCDDHWGALGHRLAADIVFDFVYAPSGAGGP